MPAKISKRLKYADVVTRVQHKWHCYSKRNASIPQTYAAPHLWAQIHCSRLEGCWESQVCVHPFGNKAKPSWDLRQTTFTHPNLGPPLPWHHLSFLKLFDLSKESSPSPTWLLIRNTHNFRSGGWEGYTVVVHAIPWKPESPLWRFWPAGLHLMLECSQRWGIHYLTRKPSPFLK